MVTEWWITDLICHDNQREVWRVAVVVDVWIADIKAILRVPVSDFDEIFTLEFEQI